MDFVLRERIVILVFAITISLLNLPYSAQDCHMIFSQP
jgi:hypothetical protein